MRAFISLCFLAVALAAPQGYNYAQQQPVSVAQQSQAFLNEALQNTKLMQTLLASQSQSGFASNTQNYYQQQQQPQLQQQQQSGGFNTAPQFGFVPQPQLQQQPQAQQTQFGQGFQGFNQPAPVVTKDIYVHVAPEEPEERFAAAPQPVAPPRKHYRIVFIKAPVPKLTGSTALRLKQAPVEEKTIIYVLTKKPDPLELETALQEVAPRQPSKPEVYFIKYKTQEEAAHAQRTIQAQYDQLGGTTQVSDEGVAPVTSVIGAFDQQSTSIASSSSSSASGVSIAGGSVNAGAGNKYLPPIVRI